MSTFSVEPTPDCARKACATVLTVHLSFQALKPVSGVFCFQTSSQNIRNYCRKTACERTNALLLLQIWQPIVKVNSINALGLFEHQCERISVQTFNAVAMVSIRCNFSPLFPVEREEQVQSFQERQIISALIWNLVHICYDGAGGGFSAARMQCSEMVCPCCLFVFLRGRSI